MASTTQMQTTPEITQRSTLSTREDSTTVLNTSPSTEADTS